VKKGNTVQETTKPMAYDALLGVVHWDVDTEDFQLPSNMILSFGSEFDDTSIEALLKDDDGIRWLIFRVDRTWYVMEQYKAEYRWVESWTKQMNIDVKEAKNYAEQEALKHYA
jgi:hypothetical protein